MASVPPTDRHAADLAAAITAQQYDAAIDAAEALELDVREHIAAGRRSGPTPGRSRVCAWPCVGTSCCLPVTRRRVSGVDATASPAKGFQPGFLNTLSE